MKRLLSILSAASLLGCASAPAPDTSTSIIDQQILDAAAKVQAAQAQLFRAGALNQELNAPSTPITDGGQPVTLSWKGDAAQLLGKLSTSRGLAFKKMGLRMPLPVVVEAKGESFESILDQLRSQVGYRAAIEQSGSTLTLQYNRPKQ